MPLRPKAKFPSRHGAKVAKRVTAHSAQTFVNGTAPGDTIKLQPGS